MQANSPVSPIKKSSSLFMEYFEDVGWSIRKAEAISFHGQLYVISDDKISILCLLLKEDGEADYSTAHSALLQMQSYTAQADSIMIVADSFSEECDQLKGFFASFIDCFELQRLVDLSQKIPNYKHLYLQPHNQLAYEEYLSRDTNRNAFVRATGVGKSYLLARIAMDIYPHPVLFVTPNLFIIEQQQKVCNGLSNIHYVTYSKLSKMSDAELALEYKSTVMLDEFHRAGSESWGEKVKLILDENEEIEVIGTSATHIRYLDNERNMAKELFYGSILAKLSLADAIAKGILPSPRYIYGAYEIGGVTEKLKKRVNAGRYTKAFKNETLDTLTGFEVDWKEFGGAAKLLNDIRFEFKGKYIVFCQHKEHMDEMAAQLPQWINEAHSAKFGQPLNEMSLLKINSSLSVKENDCSLKTFENGDKNNLSLLFVVDMLNEGKHVDDIAGVFLLRKTVSPIIFYQQIGRCFSAGNSKSPLIIDLVGNIRSIERNLFKEDLELALEIESGERNRLGLGKSPFNGSITSPNEDYGDVLAKVERAINRGHDDDVDIESIYLLNEYKQEKGSLEGINAHEELKKELKIIRSRYKNELLCERALDLLEETDLILEVDLNLKRERVIAGIMVFLEANLDENNKLPSIGDIEVISPKACYFVSNQRKLILRGESNLSADNIEKLISWGISDNKLLNDRRIETVEEIENHIRENGSLRMVKGNENHRRLMDRYRILLKALDRGDIDAELAERINKLPRPGHSRNMRKLEIIEILKQYNDSNGSLRGVSNDYKNEYKHFCKMVEQYARGRLSKAIAEALEESGLSLIPLTTSENYRLKAIENSDRYMLENDSLLGLQGESPGTYRTIYTIARAFKSNGLSKVVKDAYSICLSKQFFDNGSYYYTVISLLRELQERLSNGSSISEIRSTELNLYRRSVRLYSEYTNASLAAPVHEVVKSHPSLDFIAKLYKDFKETSSIQKVGRNNTAFKSEVSRASRISPITEEEEKVWNRTIKKRIEALGAYISEWGSLSGYSTVSNLYNYRKSLREDLALGFVSDEMLNLMTTLKVDKYLDSVDGAPSFVPGKDDLEKLRWEADQFIPILHNFLDKHGLFKANDAFRRAHRKENQFVIDLSKQLREGVSGLRTDQIESLKKIEIHYADQEGKELKVLEKIDVILSSGTAISRISPTQLSMLNRLKAKKNSGKGKAIHNEIIDSILVKDRAIKESEALTYFKEKWAEVEDYVKETGSINGISKNNGGLYQWLKKVEDRLSNDELTHSYREVIDRSDVDFSNPDSLYLNERMKLLDDLEIFIKKHGSQKNIRAHDERLYGRFKNMRKVFAAGNLQSQVIKRIEALGIDMSYTSAENPKDNARGKISALEQYLAEHGSFEAIYRNNHPLYEYLSKLIKQLKTDSMPKEKLLMLKASPIFEHLEIIPKRVRSQLETISTISEYIKSNGGLSGLRAADTKMYDRLRVFRKSVAKGGLDQRVQTKLDASLLKQYL